MSFIPQSRISRPERTFPLTLQTWAAFSAAATIMVLIPGPTVLMVISHALAHGRRAVAPLTLGVALGDLTAMTLSILGLGALLAASAALFTVLKWIGALYLIHLGIGMWRARPEAPAAVGPTVTVASGRALIGRAFAVTAVNPKGIAFFVAFLPQFVDPAHPALPQLLILGATFLALAAANAALYGRFATRCRRLFVRPAARRRLNRCGGTALLAAGLWMAFARKTA